MSNSCFLLLYLCFDDQNIFEVLDIGLPKNQTGIWRFDLYFIRTITFQYMKMTMKLYLWYRMLDPLGGYQTGILIELPTRPSQVTWYDTRPPRSSFHLQNKPICEGNQFLVDIDLSVPFAHHNSQGAAFTCYRWPFVLTKGRSCGYIDIVQVQY